MRCSDEIHSIKIELKPIVFDKPVGGSGVAGVDVIVAHIADSDGAAGLGFSYVIGGGVGEMIASLCERMADQFLLGKKLRPPADQWSEICRSFNRTGYGPNFIALAALDVGLWDLKACRENVPLGVALGGAPKPVRVYASGGFSPQASPEQSADLARDYISRGFCGVKPRVNADENDAAVLEAVRAAIGPNAMMMADANEKGRLETATRLLEHAADLNVAFIEEPLPADDPIGFRKLGALAKRTPIAAGEHFQGAAQFATAVEDGYLSYIQPDLAFAGGLTPCLAVARHAARRGIVVAPHFLPGLFVHLAGAFDGELLLEDFPLIERVFSGWPKRNMAGLLESYNVAGHGLKMLT